MVKRNLIANYLGQGWVALMGLAFVPLYIRYLGIEAYGLIGLFAVLAVWLTLFDMGMTPTIAREMARFRGGGHSSISIRNLLRSIEYIAVAAAILVAGVVFVASGWVAESWLKSEELSAASKTQAIAIMGFVASVRLVEGVYRSSVVGLQRQVILNVAEGTLATVRGLGAVAVLAWLSPTIEAYFLWQGVVSVVSLTVLRYIAYSALPSANRRAHFSIASLRKIGRFAGGMLGITFMSILLTQVDKMILSKLLLLSEYGYYALASIIAGSLFVLIRPVVQAYYPQFSQLHVAANEPELVRKYHEGAQFVSVVAGSAAIVVIVFAHDILYLWTQDSSLSGRVAPLLKLLMLGNLLNGLMWIPYQAQLAYGWTTLSMRGNMVAVAFIVPAFIWVSPRYGAEGAAWVWVALNAGYVLVGMHFMYRKMLRPEKWDWYFHDVLRPLSLAVIVVLILGYLRPISEGGAIMKVGYLLLTSCLVLGAASFGANIVKDRIKATITSFFQP
ncbi:MAG: lipopolysaccharide biosynthesis protein [bacterium]